MPRLLTVVAVLLPHFLAAAAAPAPPPASAPVREATAGARAGAAPVAATFDTLEELEARLAGNPVFASAVSAGDVPGPRLPAFARGASVYAATSYSNNDEVIDTGRSRQYQQAAVSVGVRIPVLGSRMQFDNSVAELELARERDALESRQNQRALLATLRGAYVQYWGAQRLAALAAGYLADEPRMRAVFEQRVAAGLLLDSDRRELMSTFAQASLDAAQQRRREGLALDQLRALTGSAVVAGTAAEPPLAERCGGQAPAAREPDLQGDAEIDYLRRLAEHRRAAARRPATFPLQSDVRIGYARTLEPATGEDGGSAVISWTFDYRLDRPAAADSSLAARAAQELAARQVRLRSERLEMLADEQARLETVQFAREQLAARESGVRERELRAARLAGDVYEQLQRARFGRYQAAYALAAAEEDWLAAVAQRSALLPDSCVPRPGLSRRLPDAGGGGRTLYLWSSQRLIDAFAAQRAEALVAALRRERIDRVWLSLDAAQLRTYREDDGALRRMLDATRARGIAVELLLGEPGWILPGGRAQLLELLAALRDVPFDALHLDLEPSQLESAGGTGQRHLPALLDTLTAVRQATPWRVGLSLHPRDAAAAVRGEPFANALARLGIESTLMVYVANPDRVVAIAAPLLDRAGPVPTRVALSLEAALSDAETLARKPAAERERRIRAIEAELAPHRFGGIVLQTDPDWLYRLAAATESGA